MCPTPPFFPCSTPLRQSGKAVVLRPHTSKRPWNDHLAKKSLSETISQEHKEAPRPAKTATSTPSAPAAPVAPAAAPAPAPEPRAAPPAAPVVPAPAPVPVASRRMEAPVERFERSGAWEETKKWVGFFLNQFLHVFLLWPLYQTRGHPQLSFMISQLPKRPPRLCRAQQPPLPPQPIHARELGIGGATAGAEEEATGGAASKRSEIGQVSCGCLWFLMDFYCFIFVCGVLKQIRGTRIACLGVLWFLVSFEEALALGFSQTRNKAL